MIVEKCELIIFTKLKYHQVFIQTMPTWPEWHWILAPLLALEVVQNYLCFKWLKKNPTHATNPRSTTKSETGEDEIFRGGELRIK